MDTYIATILLFAFTYVPNGWMSCDGQTLTISQYQALFSLIGTTYGGNGTTNFMLPNLNGASPLTTMKYYIAVEGLYPPK
ncbi:MAG: Tail Collar domain protein [Bacteroidetes bacterium]|nr:Tail Collar domain protein [Bacteroidota bacterium]